MEEDWGLRSVVDYLVGQCEALGSVCTTRKNKYWISSGVYIIRARDWLIWYRIVRAMSDHPPWADKAV